MALIKCSECGHEVSDKASVCPNCGAPVGLAQPSNQQLNNTYSNIDTEGSSSKKWLYLVVGILAVSLLGLAAWLFIFNEDKQNQTKQIVDSKSVTNVEKDTSSSGNDIIDNQSMNLKGKIGKYPITMHLEFDNKNVSGYYSYNSGSSKLLLKGTINNNHIELNETTEEGRSTGHFDGKVTGDKFAGEFINYKGEHFNFTLANSGVTQQTEDLSRQNDIQNDDIDNPYGLSDEEMFEIQSQRLHERAMELEEENERLIKEGPDWLQGAWRMEMTDDNGNHLGYMYEVFNHGTSKTYIDDRFMSERDYTVSDDKIMYDKGYYQLNNVRQIVLGANGQKMQKISDDPYYSPGSSSNNSSSSKGYRFSSSQDVIGWLADKSFFNGNRRLRIRPEGVWLNDYCATGAPIVERWESWKALIRAYTATGERLSFFVDPINGTVTDEASDVFRLR